jgi:hypothetical protein
MTACSLGLYRPQVLKQGHLLLKWQSECPVHARRRSSRVAPAPHEAHLNDLQAATPGSAWPPLQPRDEAMELSGAHSRQYSCQCHVVVTAVRTNVSLVAHCLHDIGAREPAMLAVQP